MGGFSGGLRRKLTEVWEHSFWGGSEKVEGGALDIQEKGENVCDGGELSVSDG
jgi:hypothetical protein